MSKKNNFSFTLLLADVTSKTAGLEDALYEAGCDDGLIHFRNGAVYIDFDRESVSFSEAVLSAIKDVESATINARVIKVAPDHLVSESDIARRANVKRQAVHNWIIRKSGTEKAFPKPVMRLNEVSPLWRWKEVAEWLCRHGDINDEKIVETAEFIENINVALEEYEEEATRVKRQTLRTRIKQVKRASELQHT